MINLLIEQCQKQGDKLAVSDANVEFSYAQVGNLSAALANHILERFIAEKAPLPDVMPIIGQRSIDYIVSVLACWRLGMAVAPLASDTPASRLSYILEDLGTDRGIVLHSATSAECSVSGSVAHRPLKRAIQFTLDQLNIGKECPVKSETSLAYVIYTSGTSGTPKGCEIGFDSLHPMTQSFCQQFEISSETRTTFVANIAFDAAMMEWLPALYCGASVFVVDKNTLLEPVKLMNLYQQNQVDFSWLPTPIAEQLMRQNGVQPPGCLKTLLTAGQQLTTRPPKHWQTKVQNAYGPTETTVIATVSKVSATGSALPDIGKPLPGVSCYVIDDAGRERPVGEVGELIVTGVGVSKGYRNRPELTEHAFFDFTDASGQCMRAYRTGDLCQKQSGGNLDFMGRKDDQVKINGHRIELKEITEALMSSDLVSQSHVLLDCNTHSRKLLACVIPSRTDSDMTAKLTAHLAQRLPTYMVPRKLMLLDSFPLTDNGKIDNNRLLQNCSENSDVQQSDKVGVLASLSKQESAFLTCFRSHIDDRLGWHQDVYQAGASSIELMQVATAINNRLQLSVPFSLFCEHRTPAAIWDCSQKNTDIHTVIEATADSGQEFIDLPLTSSQKSIWFLASLKQDDLAYHAKATLSLHGDIKVDAVRYALQKIVDRHGIFRTSFHPGDGEGMQRVHRSYKNQLVEIDLTHLPPEAAQIELDRLVQEDLNTAFVLHQLPLVRWALIKMPDGRSVLSHIEHHLVHDGWSYNIFLAEFNHFYRTFLGQDDGTLPFPTQYSDYAVAQQNWLASDQVASHLAYWQQQLDGTKNELSIPRDAMGRESTRPGMTIRQHLPRAQWEKIQAFAGARGETAFSLMFAIFSLVLHRYSGDQQVCVGSAFANREWVNADSIIGMVINTVVLKSSISPDMSLSDYLAQCFQQVQGAQKHQAVPFEHVLKQLNIKSHQGVNPLFQVFFGFHDSPMPELDLPGISKSEVFEAIDSRAAKFDLSLVVIPRKEQVGTDNPVHMLWEFKTRCFSPWFVEQLIESFAQLSAQILDGLCTQLQELELSKSVVFGPSLQVKQESMYQKFRQQALARPEKIAIVCNGTEVSYFDLLQMVDSRARHLMDMGVSNQDIVGICLPRGAEFVAWMLACQAVSAAYLPLDPDYPEARTQWIIEHSKLAFLVTDQEGFHTAKISSDVPVNAFHGGVNCAGELPMYVIYTSGSTGVPKGVEVSFDAFNNFIHGMQEYFTVCSDDCWLAVTSYSFDISALEAYLPLISGATMVIATEKQLKDLGELQSLFSQHRVSFCQATPSLWRSLVERGIQIPDTQVLCGGEELDPTLAQQLVECSGAAFNLYGPTETTVWSSVKPITSGYDGAVTLGKPIANTGVHIVDKNLEAVPVGAVGDLMISGKGLANGYLHQQELTQERFVLDRKNNKRLYFTGDLAALNEDGELVFHGRSDRQIKLNGFRIELGEIEQVIKQVTSVTDTAVVVASTNGYDSLIGYVCGDALPEDIMAYCRTRLPSYMIPNRLEVLPSLPMTPNKKVDKKALALRGVSEVVCEPPETATEVAVAEMFSELLGCDNLDRNTHFFELGGRSLLAIKVAFAIEQRFDISLDLNGFLELGSVINIAAYIDAYSKQGEEQNFVEEMLI